MKGLYSAAAVIIFICMVLFPLLSMRETVIPDMPEKINVGDIREPTDSFRLLDAETGSVTDIDTVDYICGVVAAEIGPSSSTEALKAQAVAAYTFACRRKAMRTKEKFDVSSDPATDQAYLSKDTLKERWGDDFEQYYGGIYSAVTAVKGEILTYDGAPALTVYHDISGGKTESAENMWGSAYPYLVPVESIGDVLSPDYLSSAKIGADQMKEAVTSLGGSADGDPSGWIGEPVRSDSGTVLKIAVGGKEVTGTEVRQALDLRSANFDVSFAENTFTFTVRGHGHGVGMSQYGASFMALQGSSYREILSWYYPGTELISQEKS